jgi:transketolase
MATNAEIQDLDIVDMLKKKTITIRQDVLKMIHAAQSGHPGGSLSAAEILTTLYFHTLRLDPQNPDWPDRDRFILSKGHACPVWYSCLAERGFFPVDELFTLREINSRLQGHPYIKKTPGVDMTTGPLGMGLSAAIGIALGLKLDGSQAHVYVVLGDGELNEGMIWEAAMAAPKFGLNNLIAFVDYNNLQLDGRCHEVMPIEPLIQKWLAFNWHVSEIDGHDIGSILDAIQTAQRYQVGPSLIIAHTIKGKGVTFMEDECDWHGRAPNDAQLALALTELSASME